MRKKSLEYYKKKLLKLRNSLVEEIERLEGRSLSKTQRDSTGDLRGSEEDLLYKVDQALYRIAKRTYGLCIQCQRKIDKKRLDAIPYAELCIKCQATQEKKT